MNTINNSPGTCLFCKFVDREKSAQIVFEDGKSLVFMDTSPVNPGHILVIPKKHEDHLWDLDDDVYLHLFKVAKKMAKVLRAVMGGERVGVIVEGFSISHAHIQLTPLNTGSDIKREGHPDNSNNLEVEAQQIRDALK